MVEQETTQETTETQETAQETRPEPSVPKHRFDELNQRMKAAEKKAKDLENAEEQRQLDKAQSVGEYQEVIKKKDKRIETLTRELHEERAGRSRDKRYRAWTEVAPSLIKANAISDAFNMITDDEWAAINEDDENSVKMLAQNLAERKEYLAAGPIGSGSRGSGQPVFGLQTNNKGKQGTQTGRPTMHFKKSRPSWK